MAETTCNSYAGVPLEASITSSQTTITRASSTNGWPGDSNGPASGNFRLTITDGTNFEIVMVTGGQGTTTLTVSRAYELIQGVQTGYAFGTNATMIPTATAAYLAGLGGGGAGNVSTVDATTVDQGRMTLLSYPALDGTYGDDFDTGTLNGKWSYYAGSAANTTDLTGWVHLVGAPGACAIIQPCPGSGNWVIETELIPQSSDTAQFLDDGIIVTSGSAEGSSTDMRLGAGMADQFYDYRIVWESFVNGTYSSAYVTNLASFQAPLVAPVYLQLSWNGTNFTARWSYNRINWYALGTAQTPGFTPAYFGLHSGGGGSYQNYFRFSV